MCSNFSYLAFKLAAILGANRYQKVYGQGASGKDNRGSAVGKLMVCTAFFTLTLA